MADEPKPDETSDYPIKDEQVERHITDVRALADAAFEQAGWNKKKRARPRRKRN